MKSMLERITIKGLHGNKDLDVKIKDNTLVLVGENGSGKTTFLRIVFYILSQDWDKLVNFKFEKISFTINGKERNIDYKELLDTNSEPIDLERHPGFRRLPFRLKHLVHSLVSEGKIEQAIRVISNEDFENIFYEEFIDFIRRRKPKNRKSNNKLIKTIYQIRNEIKAQILYLPTYRRIEQELENIFEDIDYDARRLINSRFRQNETKRSYIELVKFGMQDVKDAIERNLDNLKDFARQELNQLTLGYLGDVVNKEFDPITIEEITSLSDESIQAILKRIPENILKNTSRSKLLETITNAHSAKRIDVYVKIICHYIIKLQKFQESLLNKEKNISKFCELCSEYMSDKRFVYDTSNFSFNIYSTLSKEQNSLNLSDLSSGEKQIVSLFSHLYLSGNDKYFVLIDEPELSLSVPWQKKFLKDINDGHLCIGLIAVTHSPFTYDNELAQYAHSIGEFIG